MLLFEQEITRKKWMDKTSQPKLELDESNSKEYEVKAICNSKFYVKESDRDHYLLSLYYLVF